MIQVVGTLNPGTIGVPDNINDIIAGLVQLLIATAGIIFFFMLLIGGLKYLSAGGDEKAAASARATLTQAIIGLIIVAGSIVVTGLIFNIFKIQGIRFS
jgi:hypothetical protein